MRVSLKWLKKYIDLPNELTYQKIAYDLTEKTVEVEKIENIKDKYNNIVVGKILEVKRHPNADLLRICMVDIGDKVVQIVCGGSNLYENELVVISLPGALVHWHGDAELVKIKETKMRGVQSYGMICGASEVFLEELFPPSDEHEIVDLKGIDCKPGDLISEVLGFDDIIFEIDNKSLSNRPDLWGHHGIARELSVIYDLPLKEIPSVKIDKNLPSFDIEIECKDKCQRYVGIAIKGVDNRKSPLWMQALLIECGLRPINAIVDITNYVMLSTGQPMHAFDKTHVEGNKIIVRNAKKDEKLLLLDNNEIELTTDDLVISDIKSVLALAGIRGGKKDSVLDSTKEILLEVANFTPSSIRKTGKRFLEKTDASIRYEKGLDTKRVDIGVNLALSLFKSIFPLCVITAYTDNYPVKEDIITIDVSQEFLNERMGKVIDSNVISKLLTALGYNVQYKSGIYHVEVPSWRATGDVSLKDDVMGDIVRILGFSSFEAKPLPVSFEHAVLQNKVLLDRRIREYLAVRCGFNEIITYPWVNEKYIDASGLDKGSLVKLATPPSPEQAYLRGSLIPGILESISKNLRYYNEFKIFEATQVFEKGEYHESSMDETLPIHKNYVSGAIVSKDAKGIFYQVKGVIENMSAYTHMEGLSFEKNDKPTWADVNAYLDIISNGKKVGTMGLLSIKTMMDAKIKRCNVCAFEINFDELNPLSSRTNKFEHLPLLPLITKDLSLIMNEDVTWNDIYELIKGKVKKVEFIEEYRGEQIPESKKSIVLRLSLDSGDVSLTADEINEKVNSILKSLDKKLGVTLRTF